MFADTEQSILYKSKQEFPNTNAARKARFNISEFYQILYECKSPKYSFITHHSNQSIMDR